MNLFGEEEPEPLKVDLGEAVLKAARMAVRKRLRGNCPPGMDRDDLIQEVAIRALKKCARYKPGRKTLAEFAYVAACFCLNDFFRDRAKIRDVEKDLLDAGGLLELDEARDLPSHYLHEKEVEDDDELEALAAGADLKVFALPRATSAA